MTDKPSVTVRRHFDASPERVFDAWLDSETVGQWLFATPTGQMVKVEIDARVGGRFVIVERRDGEDVEHTGEFLEIDRPRRLVMTFGVPKYSANTTKVTVEITASGSGCDLTLTSDNLDAEYVERTKQGWAMILDGLARTRGL